MEENTHQPFLGTSTSKKIATKFKVVYAVVALTALLVAVATIFSVSIPRNREQLCNHASDPSSCLAMLSELPQSPGLMQQSDTDILRMLLAKSLSQIRETLEFTGHLNSRINDKPTQFGLADCLELLDISAYRVENTMAALKTLTSKSHSDAHSWLSAVLANHFTCLDGLNREALVFLEPKMKELIAESRTSLALVVAIAPLEDDTLMPLKKRGFPSWVSGKDKKLLEASARDIAADLVVAQDGSGNYTTVQEAVDAAPTRSGTRFVIYVKNGTYVEKVDVSSRKWNLMLVGDGMDSTIITGSLSMPNVSTFHTATVAAVGDGFIAQDICFQNTAGPLRDQAVALRVGADKSVINRCKVDAFQDTLYPHSNRQFYRDCYITGTVDFIFGFAAAVLQNCQLVPRLPRRGQSNMVTAHGLNEPNSDTGFSIQLCSITASSDLQPEVGSSVKSFLGRPWGDYSRTVVMQSYISDVIDPAGWQRWNDVNPVDKLYYGEYLNFGPGAGTSERVNWPGYHVITSAKVAENFTVAKLIDGGDWLEDGVPYFLGLSD